VTNAQVMGVVGPFDSLAAVAALPALAQTGVVTISPTATLPGLTKADQATTEGLAISQWRPQGKPISFFRLTADDNAIAAAAADLALASPQAHGLGSHSVYVVDDGSPSGKAQSAAFQAELKTGHGTVAGSRSVALGDEISMQTTVSAIVEASPDSVYFAGDPAAAADLRRTLTQTGAPQLVLLTAGAAADDPAWSDTVGAPVLSGYTVGLLPTQALTKLAGAQAFQTAYQSAYPGATVTPQSALAYDAAIVEIRAIKSLIAAQKTPTRAATLSAVTATNLAGVTGQIAFDKNGDPTAPPDFSIYTSDTKGIWTYQASVAAKAAA
jgi:branched-chain amino acid transport system substrate-binding protein